MVLVEHHKWVGIHRGHSSLKNRQISGWNSWNAYQCQVNETAIRYTSDIVVVTGLAAVGYEYSLLFYRSFQLLAFVCS